MTGFWEVTPVNHVNLRTYRRTTDNGVGKRSQAGLSLLEDIDSPTRGLCAILSRDLVAQEESILHIWKAIGVMQQLSADVFW